MKKLILCIGIMGVAVAVVVAFLLVGCDDTASMNNGGAVDGFLVRVNEKTGTSGGGGSGNTYQVTVNSAGIGQTGSGANLVGAMVQIYAGTLPAPHRFERWASSKNVTFANPNSETTTFIMPASNVTVTAVFWDWGTFTDRRDQKKYKTTTINGKKWMAENLNYLTSRGSWCYDNADSSCVKYGRLYDWSIAKIVCPTGWHLPNIEEWRRLVESAGGSSTAGKKLKAANGWRKGEDTDNGNGTDDFGFSALPGGVRYPNDRHPEGAFTGVGFYGDWWTATESDYGNDGKYLGMSCNNDEVPEIDYGEDWSRSVRCVEDD